MKIIQEQLDINYTRKCFMDILELIRIVRMRTPAIRPVGLILIQIVKKTMAVKALKGQYVALLVQSLPHCTTSTNPLLRLNSLIQQTDTRYFSSDTGQMDGKEKKSTKAITFNRVSFLLASVVFVHYMYV